MRKLKSEIVRWSNAKLLGLIGLLLLATIALSYNFWPVKKNQLIAQFAPMPIKYDFNVTQPLPEHVELDGNKVVLGEKLFNEVRLSENNTVSCANCHVLLNGGTDNRYRSVGVNGGTGEVNAPTVLNSGFNFVQFWDGRALSLESQIEGPVNHPKEMASNWRQVLNKLQLDSDYSKQFAKLYQDGITPTNIKDAIATFERSLTTPNSRFDKYLRGNFDALSPTEVVGYELFQSYGCATCHQGINLGGNMFEKMGLMGDYFTDRGNVTQADNGRFNLNRNEESMHEFRVPSLRNVALTAPYFHDGNAKTLEDAITIMAKYQLGRNMPETDLEAIAAYLRTLTGEFKDNPL